METNKYITVFSQDQYPRVGKGTTLVFSLSLDQWLSTGDDFAPSGHLAMIRDIFGCHTRGRYCWETRIQTTVSLEKNCRMTPPVWHHSCKLKSHSQSNSIYSDTCVWKHKNAMGGGQSCGCLEAWGGEWEPAGRTRWRQCRLLGFIWKTKQYENTFTNVDSGWWTLVILLHFCVLNLFLKRK